MGCGGVVVTLGSVILGDKVLGVDKEEAASSGIQLEFGFES